MAKKQTNKFLEKYGVWLLIAVLIIAFLVLALITGGKKEDSKTETCDGIKLISETAGLTKMEVSDWKTKVKEDSCVITTFAQTGCSWCNKFKPEAEEVTAEKNFNIVWFDIDTLTEAESNSLLSTFADLKDFGTPHTIITKNNKIIYTIDGYVDAASLKTKLKSYGILKEETSE